MHAPAVEPETDGAGAERTPGPRPPQACADAWERFLLERALESGRRPLGRWRDEEGL
jgi:hypothetical protein